MFKFYGTNQGQCLKFCFSDPDKLTGFCGMAWSTETDPDTGLRKYRLENFPSEEATREAGFNITHKGQCGGKLHHLKAYDVM